MFHLEFRISNYHFLKLRVITQTEKLFQEIQKPKALNKLRAFGI